MDVGACYCFESSPFGCRLFKVFQLSVLLVPSAVLPTVWTRG